MQHARPSAWRSEKRKQFSFLEARSGKRFPLRDTRAGKRLLKLKNVEIQEIIFLVLYPVRSVRIAENGLGSCIGYLLVPGPRTEGSK